MEHCIVYFSTSVGAFEEEDLNTILQQSRDNNPPQGITGVMLYVRGSIIQVLEGDREVLERLYSKIERDPRHTGISKVFSRSIGKRLFADWNMGYETITTQQLTNIQDIVKLDSSGKPVLNDDDHIVLKTIKVFYDSNRYN